MVHVDTLLGLFDLHVIGVKQQTEKRKGFIRNANFVGMCPVFHNWTNDSTMKKNKNSAVTFSYKNAAFLCLINPFPIWF